MELVFNKNNFVDQIINNYELQENRKKIFENRHKYVVLKNVINSRKYEIEKLELELQQAKNLKNYIFKYRETREKINNLEDALKFEYSYLETKEKELNESNKTFSELNELVEELEKNSVLEIPDSVTLVDNEIIINDKENNIQVDENSEIEVIVHCTNFFPEDKIIKTNYDGNKRFNVDVSYEGVKKNIEYLHHRHTCHFTRNATVQETSQGDSWDQPMYIVIESFEPHVTQFVETVPSDSYTYGSLKLGDNPIMLIRSDIYDKVPKEKLAGYQVMKYDGAYSKCVANLFKILGIKMYQTDANAPHHWHSIENISNKLLNTRNILINYIKDNTYDGKSDITFDENEIFELYDISINSLEYDNCLRNLKEFFGSEEKIDDIPRKFIEFIYYFGIYQENNIYKIKNDNEIYNNLKKLYNIYYNRKGQIKEDISTYGYDLEEIKKLYNGYPGYKNKQSLKNNDKYDISHINQLLDLSTKELYKFSNIELAKIICNYVNKLGISNFALTETGCKLEFVGTTDQYPISIISQYGFNTKFPDNPNLNQYQFFININAGTVGEMIIEIKKVIELLKQIKNTNNTLNEEDSKHM